MSLPHEDFLRELYALCQNHGVHLDGTEDDGAVVVPNDAEDGGVPVEDDGLTRPEQFAFFRCETDGSILCHPAKLGGAYGDIPEPDYDAGALGLPR